MFFKNGGVPCAVEPLEARRLMSGEDLTDDGGVATDTVATGSAHTGGILVGLGDGSVGHHDDGGSQAQLEGQQCLVFYLGGTR